MTEANHILNFKERLLLFVTLFFSSSFLGYIGNSKSFHQQRTQTELINSNNNHSNKNEVLYNKLILFTGKKGALFNFYEYIKSAILTLDKQTKIKYDNFSIKEYFPQITQLFIHLQQIPLNSKEGIFITIAGQPILN
jgi:hypothetical protein